MSAHHSNKWLRDRVRELETENTRLRLLLDVSTKAMRLATVDLRSVEDRDDERKGVLDSVLRTRLDQSVGELRAAAAANDAALASDKTANRQPAAQS